MKSNVNHYQITPSLVLHGPCASVAHPDQFQMILRNFGISNRCQVYWDQHDYKLVLHKPQGLVYFETTTAKSSNESSVESIIIKYSCISIFWQRGTLTRLSSTWICRSGNKWSNCRILSLKKSKWIRPQMWINTLHWEMECMSTLSA